VDIIITIPHLPVTSILQLFSQSFLVKKTNFRGTLKVAFTVEEEIGCLGSHAIDQDFIEGARLM
jgi:hypothetical protein